MDPLFSGQLVGVLTSALGVLIIAYIRKGRKDEREQDQNDVPEAYLVDIKNITGKQDYRISGNVSTIGRRKEKDMDICIAKNTISMPHAQIEYRNGNFYLTDLRSRNGTYLNGGKERIIGEVYIRNGDTISFDEYIFRFIVHSKKRRRVERLDAGSHSHTIMRSPTK